LSPLTALLPFLVMSWDGLHALRAQRGNSTRSPSAIRARHRVHRPRPL